MPFSANFVKITLRDGALLVEGQSEQDEVDRITSMQVAIDTVSHANGGGNGSQMQTVPVGDIQGSGDWVVTITYDNDTAPEVGTSMLVAGATVLTPDHDGDGTTDSPFIWFQTLPVEQ
jgi:hypothetical protein